MSTFARPVNGQATRKYRIMNTSVPATDSSVSHLRIWPGAFLSYLNVGIGARLAESGGIKRVGVLYCSMKGSTQFNARPCPDCSEDTGLVHLGGQPPREVCGRFGCSWDGITLRPNQPVREETADIVRKTHQSIGETHWYPACPECEHYCNAHDNSHWYPDE